MTQKRRDEHSTEFGLWLRKQAEIDSSLGYVTTNIDYFWTNYKIRKWMLIEEKRNLSRPRFYQEDAFQIMDTCAKNDPFYKGFHVIRFENTSPDDGIIILDGKLRTREQLIQFLQFKE